MFRIFTLVVFGVAFGSLSIDAAQSAAAIAGQLNHIGLDAHECYRVIDLNFSKGDARIYLTSGYLIFAKPVNGERIAAVFASDVEGGDGEILLLPPLRSERLSLANFTESPNLDEHFHSALMIFTDGTEDTLLTELHANPLDKRVPEMGALLAEKSSGILQNLVASFEVRLVQDLLSAPGRPGVFYIAVGGRKLGNFDVIYDPGAKEQMLAGQLAYRDNRTYFDVWTSFAIKSKSKSPVQKRETEPVLDNFRIEATVQPDLTVKAITHLTLTPKNALERVLPFSISRQMRVHDVEVDGRPVEVFQKESLRANLIRGPENETILVVTPEPLTAGQPHEIVFRHEGAVISKAGDRVYYVGARGTWYPRHDMEFARYDLTFRYPKTLNLVATGEVVEDRTDGEWRITRRRSASPIRFAGFNLGDYESVQVDRGSYRILAYANRRLETALQPKSPVIAQFPPPNALGRRRQFDATQLPVAAPPADPTARLQTLADNIANAFDFMTAAFGPPATKTVAITPIPGGFGQGFPGLVYLSTVAYLDPAQRPPMHDRFQQTFFSEVLQAHELAHQWWGNLVIVDGYQDVWLMESLANYSALMYLEKKSGTRALDATLDQYKTRLLAKGPNGRPVESAGPVTLGYRLQSSQSPEAANVITYEKGTWVMHMLRKRLGDAPFEKMLREICQTYRYRTLSTDQFRQAASRFLPPHTPDPDLTGFFDAWVYGTGIPAVKLTCAMHGLKLTGTVAQSEVPEDFTAYVPIEVQIGRQKTLEWVATGSDPIPFSIPLHRPPSKVGLDTNDSLITKKP
ncbi:MAG: M1 family aminopeptidase [Bryobacteraceae bacterium]